MLIKLLVYFIPFAINFLNGGFFFITSYRFAEAGCSGVIVGGAVAAWGIVYCTISSLIGRIAKAANALPLILAGGTLLLTAAAGFLIFDGLYMQFLWLVISGWGAAMFCTPFQLLVKDLESGRKDSGAVRAAAFYTLTWSAGFATGPLAFARLSVRQGFFVTLLLAAAVDASALAIAMMLRKRRKKGNMKKESVEEREKSGSWNLRFSTKSFTKLALLGWLVGGLGSITVCQIRSMWPKLGSELCIPQHHVAYILALVSYVQALTAFSLCRSRNWMWRRIPGLLMSLCGIASLVMFAFCRNVISFYAAAVIYGIYSGCFFFYLVYHSLAHPERNGYFVAGNEVIVGVTSLVFPIVGGWLADLFGTESAFIFAAFAVVVSFIGQILVLNSIPECEK